MRRYVWRGPADTRRELAENLGVGRSAPTRWIGRNRDRQIDAPEKARSEDMTAEPKRRRRENGILRQERDILKPQPPRAARARDGRSPRQGPAASRRGLKISPLGRTAMSRLSFETSIDGVHLHPSLRHRARGTPSAGHSSRPRLPEPLASFAQATVRVRSPFGKLRRRAGNQAEERAPLPLDEPVSRPPPLACH